MTTAPVSAAAPFSPAAELKPKDAAGAAKQFESLLMAQMLRTARESSEDDDSTAETMFDVAGQQFAQVLASNGGLGLAKLITRDLAPKP